jgi:hypothetical protein
MGYVANTVKYNHPFDCGFPVTQVGPQNLTDTHDTNCGSSKYNIHLIPKGTALPPME